MSDDRFSFVLNYFDPQAELVKQYNMMFFASDNSIEIHDPKLRRVFLRRLPYPSITLKDLVVGNTLEIHSRQMKIVDYGDAFTRETLQGCREDTFMIIPPHAFEATGLIIQSLLDADVRLTKIISTTVPPQVSHDLVGFDLSSGVSVCLKLNGPNAVSLALNAASKYSTFAPSSPSDHASSMDTIFNQRPSATSSNCALLLIRPHVVKGNTLGNIIDAILSSGFSVSCIGSINFTKSQACEFLEVYRGVLNEFEGWANDLSSGMSIAVEIIGDSDVVNRLRDWIGPFDPEIARQLEPNSLRALYGETRIKNGFHVTDLAEDGPLESQYVFQFLYHN
ncbi:hypothetical protein RCL1_005654 [Eukaryota sp. TZLM3-RCL]